MMSILNRSSLMNCSNFSLLRAGLTKRMRGKREQFVQTYVVIVLLLYYTSSKTHRQMKSIEMRTEFKKDNEKDRQRQRVYRHSEKADHRCSWPLELI